MATVRHPSRTLLSADLAVAVGCLLATVLALTGGQTNSSDDILRR